ncbi:MAG: hypothetical protein GF308_19130 [Candidatus Heimdallarchaeota archaeon]|nr:hypothetical protein [Candidatus Heimdallarchaeota archaeon]
MGSVQTSDKVYNTRSLGIHGFSIFKLLRNNKFLIIWSIVFVCIDLITWTRTYIYYPELAFSFRILMGHIAHQVFFFIVIIIIKFQNKQFDKLLYLDPHGFNWDLDTDDEREQALESLRNSSLSQLFCDGFILPPKTLGSTRENKSTGSQQKTFSFYDYCFDTLKALTNKWLNIIPFLFFICLFGFYWGYFVFYKNQPILYYLDLEEVIGVLTSPFTIFNEILGLIIVRFINYPIYLLLVLYHIIFIISFRHLKQDEYRKALTIHNLDNLLKKLPVNKNVNFFESFARYSIRVFKRKTTPIVNYALSITIVSLFIITLGASAIVILWIPINAAGINYSFLIFFTAIASAMIFYGFFSPQKSAHHILEFAKRDLILTLDGRYQYFLVHYLVDEGDSSNRVRTNLDNPLWVELNFLSGQIRKLKELITWPYNYKQLVTVIISSIIPTIITIIIYLIERKFL